MAEREVSNSIVHILNVLNEIGDNLNHPTTEEDTAETEITEGILLKQPPEELLDHAVNQFINQAILSLEPIISSISAVCDANKKRY